ncbi:SMC-Scp complex subunit ScpB [Micromonospora sp. NPDC048830]|uniref:SMC-Scp complex subunit ScpB n=1 Tax=Micromonospora sp. NPDC048830 TaxID=3364257 RepID=UPI00371AE33C
MSDEERQDSLADQAAAWVPPWERPRPPAARRPQEDLGSERPTEEPNPPTGPDPDAADIALVAVPDAVPAAVPAAEPAATSVAEPPQTVLPAAAPAEAAPAEAAQPDAARSEAGERQVEAGERHVEAGERHVEAGERDTAAGVPRKQPAGRRRTTAAPEPPPELDDRELRAALEAILLVVDEPVSELTLAQVLEQPPERVGAMLDDIAAGYTAAGHGFELRRAAGGWRLYTRPEYATYVERFVLDGQSVRLTQAALETLAVVAYKQPVTRSRISAIRGVNCDGVIRTLVSRGLVEECGTEPDSGAFLYRTTTMFLEKLGLNSVDELPPLAPFLPDDVEELADATR